MQSPQQPYRLNIKRGKKPASANEVASFLRLSDKLSPLLPTVKRNLALQKECESVLPPMFAHCAVLNLAEDQLILSAPNAAVASKLKQQTPKLLAHLQQQGWQINAIRIKVQVKKTVEKPPAVKQAILTPSAVNAFKTLENALPTSKENAALKQALARLLARNGVS